MESTRRNALILAVGVLGALGFLPQLGGPGYDAALVSGAVLPAIAASAAALELSTSRMRSSDAVARGASLGALLAVAGLLVMLLHGARVGFCDPSEGLWLYVLGPAFGAALGGVWGALMGLVTARLSAERPRWQRRTLAIALALSGPLAGMGVSFYRFLTSPMVFAFDPFFGVFAGPLYDTVVNVVDRLLSYRQGTVATLLAVTLGASLFDRMREEGARATWRARPGTAVLAFAAAVLSLAHSASGPRLGHWSTSASIEEALGGHYLGRRCDVIHPRAMAQRDVALFTRDCDGSVAQVESYFGARGPEHIRVFLFANESEKGWLMGASHTYIAKPWRREVYVQQAAYPHPVIAHELAHVIAGSFSSGPFHVAGPLHGWLPDPGRIEGFAVAAAPDETDELTDLEWAAAMQDLGILPPLRSVFQLEFLSITASKAYTVAGAFVGFLRERYGMPALRRWYAGATLPEVTGGKDLDALDLDFRKALKALAVTSRAQGTAKVRFERAPFFARHCPRIVDRKLGEAGLRLAAGDVTGAETGYREALGLDPRNVDARFGLAGCEHQRGNTGGAVAKYVALGAGGDLMQIQVSHALENAADLELSADHPDQAKALYTRALDLTFDEDRRRTLEVKRWASGTPAQKPVVALLIGTPDTPASWEVAAPLIQGWADHELFDDVPAYLIGRNLLNGGHYAEAAGYLAIALDRRSPLASVHREAVRLRVIAACALGEDPRHWGAVEALEKDTELARARRDGLLRLMERCTGTVGAASQPAPTPTPSNIPVSVSPAASTPPPSAAPRTCPAGMSKVPGGKFWVGAEPSEGFADDESPRFLTELADLCMDETEVTAGAYAACVERGACRAPERHGLLCNFGRPERAEHPINCVTWPDADAYCSARGARLPTEVELEYVARAGSAYSKYPWGDDSPDGHACWKHAGTCAVKSFPVGAFGLYDVSGNVWEWGSDWYGPYPWPPENAYSRVYRGGSFSRRFEKWMHTGLRNRQAPNQAGAHLGFRCALTLGSCPFGEERPGICRHGVLERTCPKGKTFNGVRCALPDEPRCGEGWVERAGYGCVLGTAEDATV